MKKNLLLLSLLYASTFTDLLAAPPSYIQTKDGVIITIYFKASFNLYEDEGTNYNYGKADYAFIPIKYTEATKTITVGDRKGSFDGMLSKRIFRINLLSPEHARNLDFDAKGDKETFYEEKKIVIKLSSN